MSPNSNTNQKHKKFRFQYNIYFFSEAAILKQIFGDIISRLCYYDKVSGIGYILNRIYEIADGVAIERKNISL